MIESMDTFPPYMDYENFRYHIDNLYSDEPIKILEALKKIKNSVIGSSKQKNSVIAQGMVPRLMQLLQNGIPNSNLSIKIRVEAVITLGSLARGSQFHVQSLADADLVNLLIKVLNEISNEETNQTNNIGESKEENEKMQISEEQENMQRKETNNINFISTEKDKRNLISGCLRCLRSLSQHGHLISLNHPKLLLKFAESIYSTEDRACVALIIATSCVSQQDQDALCDTNAASILTGLLVFAPQNLMINALKCIAAFSKEHAQASLMLEQTGAAKLLANLIERCRPANIQLGASKCLSHMYRAGALEANDPKLVYKALPCLARLCHHEQPTSIRTEAANTLAYLTEIDTDLQKIASISYHLINELGELLLGSDVEGKQAAFRAFASIGANDEGTRKKIIDSNNLMVRLVTGFNHENNGVRLAAVRCLHSLSRSVQLLRTTFQDHCVWQPLMTILSSKPPPDLEFLTVASSTLCNLLLEFSPAKEPILELGKYHKIGALKLLCELTERNEAELRLNGVWALMNMAFQAELRVKQQILTHLTTDNIFRLLTDSDTRVIMKTLGLLRNILSTSNHIDMILIHHAIPIIQAMVLVLESHHGAEIKEQAICTLGNIADGDDGKAYILKNDDVLKKLIHYMMHSDTRLATASIFCFANLVRRNKIGTHERQSKLKSLGVLNLLKQLQQNSQDQLLLEKVKSTIAEFIE